MEEKKNPSDVLADLARKMKLANGDHYEMTEVETVDGVTSSTWNMTKQGAMVLMAVAETSTIAGIDGALSPTMMAIMNQIAKATGAVSIASFQEFERQVKACPADMVPFWPAIQAFVVASIIGTCEQHWMQHPHAKDPTIRAMMAVFAESGERLGAAVGKRVSDLKIQGRVKSIIDEALADAKGGGASPRRATMTDEEVNRILRRPRGSA